MANVLVVAETRGGELRKVALEAVTAARVLADAVGGEVHALAFGPAGVGAKLPRWPNMAPISCLPASMLHTPTTIQSPWQLRWRHASRRVDIARVCSALRRRGRIWLLVSRPRPEFRWPRMPRRLRSRGMPCE